MIWYKIWIILSWYWSHLTELSFVQLRDCELGAIVNRDLSRRIRTVNGITSHRSVVRSDIKLSAKIIQNLDSRWGLWVESTEALDNAVRLHSQVWLVLFWGRQFLFNAYDQTFFLDTRIDTCDLFLGWQQLLSLTSSSNPVLRNITDYLIEEASAEEEELLGANDASANSSEEKAEGEAIERDPSLIKVSNLSNLFTVEKNVLIQIIKV